ncbi:MAG: hypothetical protein R3E31_22835 [Chloroflexota bacterium]
MRGIDDEPRHGRFRFPPARSLLRQRRLQGGGQRIHVANHHIRQQP